MSRTSVARAYLREQNKKWPMRLAVVPREEWPNAMLAMRAAPDAVWRSRTILVQRYPKSNGAIRLSISRTEMEEGGGWAQDLSWERLQEIKEELGYGPMCAVEIFPPEADVVNVANMRHLWIVDHAPDFMWRSVRG